jgi:hypothetical protein
MIRRFIPMLIVVGLVAPAAGVRPAQAQDGPAIVVRMGSIDGLLADAKFFATQVGKGEEAVQAEKAILAKVGKKGLDGIDTKRPLGMYVTLDKDDPAQSKAVILVPISDEEAFLNLLTGLNFPAEKGDDGVYNVRAPGVPVPIYFRFANKYAYGTALHRSALDKANLIDPATLLPPGGTGVASASVRIDRIPANMKQLALSRLDLAIADETEKRKPGESDTEHAFKGKVLKVMGDEIKAIILDGKELAARLDFDRQGEQIVAEMSLDAQSGSKLAGMIADYGKSRSLFSSTAGPEAAAAGLVSYALPAEIRQAFADLMDKAAKEGLEKETDPAKRAQAEKLLKALEPSWKAGELDLGFSFRGPTANQQDPAGGGITLKDGQGVEKVLRDLIGQLPAGDRDKIKLDAETVAGTKVHQIELKGADLDRGMRKVVGDSPAMYVAIRNDAAFAAIGDDALAAIKDALAAKPKEGPLVLLEMSVKRFAPALAQDNPRALPAAQAAFGTASGNDKIILTVEGGNALKARFVMKAPVVKFLAEIGNKADD